MIFIIIRIILFQISFIKTLCFYGIRTRLSQFSRVRSREFVAHFMYGHNKARISAYDERDIQIYAQQGSPPPPWADAVFHEKSSSILRTIGNQKLSNPLNTHLLVHIDACDGFWSRVIRLGRCVCINGGCLTIACTRLVDCSVALVRIPY